MSTPNPGSGAELIRKIQAMPAKRQRAVIALLTKRGVDLSALDIIPRLPRSQDQPPPLSFAQQRLWFLAQLEGTSAYYNVPMAMRLHGPLDRAAMRRALTGLVRRHEALRTRFEEREGVPYQCIDDGTAFTVREQDVVDPAQVAGICQREMLTAFDLARDTLIRALLLRVSETEHVLMVTMHHTVSDGWSVGVFFREVTELYEAARQGRNDTLEPLPVQYADFADWQRQWLAGEAQDRQIDYWKQRLAGVDAGLTLPADRPRPPVRGYEGTREFFQCPPLLLERLRALGERHGATLYMTLLAAYSVVLHRYTQQTDITVGTVVANRNRVETEGLIGLFANTLVMRNSLDGDPAFTELLARVKHTALEAYDHQDVPFEALVDALKVERALSHSPVFQTVLVLQEEQAEPRLTLGGMEVTPVDVDFTIAKFDLTLDLRETPQGLAGAVEYSTALFDRETIRRFVRHFTTLLAAVTEAPQQPISRLTLLDGAELDAVARRWRAPSGPAPEPARRIDEWFQEVVRRTPDAVAVTCEDRSLTYAELNALANRLARYLRASGVVRDTPAALCLPRGEWLVIGALAVLKAGGAYVPLDRTAPVERLAHVLSDSAPKAVLVDGALPEGLNAGGAQVVDVRGDWEWLPDDDLEPMTGASPEDLAYVIYTSGSTGLPKGVLVEHHNVTRLFTTTRHSFGFRSEDVWTLFHSFAFDFTVWETWGALLHGGRLVVVPHEVARSPREFYALLCEQGVTVLNQTPSAFGQLIAAQGEDGARHRLRTVVFGGEALDPTALRPWFARPVNAATELVNMYGITETTVHVTHRTVTEADTGSALSPIGGPLPDLNVYVLDRHLDPVPTGAVGEMYVGGEGVARGYLNRPELTTDRFLDDPFRGVPGARMYRTGDLARQLADGSLEYHGRNDDQVKIRGHRIEPGEVSARLNEHPGVRSCAVVVREDRPGNRQLVAYVVPAADQDEEGLQAQLDGLARRALPEYMLPGAYVLLPDLPLTTNGKLDRAALPAPGIDAYAQRRNHAYVAPAEGTETALAGVWADLLGFDADRIGAHDNFFTLGGHSLLITVLVARLRAAGLHLTVRDLFDDATLSGLAARIDAAATGTDDTSRGTGEDPASESGGTGHHVPPNTVPEGCERLTPELLPLVRLGQEHLDAIAERVPGGAPNVQDVYPLVPSQEGILFHHLMDPENDPYVMSAVFAADDEAACTAFLAALQSVIDRHDVMRTAVLTEGMPEPVQVVYRAATLPVQHIDLPEPEEPGADAEDRARALAGLPAELPPDRAPMLSVRIARDPASHRRFLLMNFHHLIEDATSMRLIADELAAHMAGRSDLLTAAAPYRDFVARTLHQLATGDAEQYFRTTFGDVTEATVPFGLNDVHGDGRRIRKPRRSLPAELTRRLRAEAGRLGLSPAWLFHAACARVVAAGSGRDDVVFGTVMSGRLQGVPGVERMLGNFINTLPLRVRLAGRTVRELVDDVAGDLRELIVREQSSLSLAQRCSGLDGDTPLFTAAINFRHFEPARDDAPAPALERQGIHWLTVMDRTNYPMGMSLDDLGDELSLTVQIEDTVEPETLLSYVETALAGIVDALAADDGHGTGALDIDVLPPAERDRLLTAARGARPPYAQDSCLAELFEQQAAERPDAPAVRHGERRLTYAQLNARANQVAHHLRGLGVGPDTLVGVCADRSPELVVALLGVLKAGGAYVPIDPGYPEQRIRALLDGSGVRVLLGRSGLPDTLFEQLDEVLHLDTGERADDRAQVLDPMPTHNPDRAALGLTPDHLAYAVFTSGSTGRPKGVLVEQRGVARLVCNPDYFAADESTAVLHHSSISFDAGSQEILTPLVRGGLLVLHDGDSKDPAQLLDCVERAGVTTMLLSAAFLPAFAEAAQTRGELPLRELAVVGDTFSARDVRRLYTAHPNLTVTNGYGPTENSIASTYHVIPRDLAEDSRVPIGVPVPHTTAYVTDERLRLVPDGVIGELCLGGVGVARGYLDNPELTARRFVDDPFGDAPGGRLYRTGDLVRRRPDGTLEFRGRMDEQVKVRGFRVEPGEIETALNAHPSVHSAVVVPRADGEAGTLSAYVRPTEEWLEQAAAEQTAENLVQWHRLFENQYSRDAEAAVPDDLNLAGWESSYSGEPIPEAEMREWIDGAVERIRELRPKRLLEIGCGTGLLLFRYAQECERVHGIDISAAALADVRRGAERRGWSHITLGEGDALSVADLVDETFDVVVLNSVAQYFPSRHYLQEVIARILPRLEHGGRILLGDIRNLDLFSEHVCAVERSRSGAPSTAGALAGQVQRRRRQETELLVSPSFFAGLPQRFEDLDGVDIMVKRGTGGNEMLAYRYDVVLTKGRGAKATDLPWLEATGPAELRALLLGDVPERFGVTGLSNPRIAEDVRVLASLARLAPSRQVDPLPGGERLSARAREETREIAAVLRHAEELGYYVAATWSQNRPDGLDLVLGRDERPPVLARGPYRTRRLANAPQIDRIGPGLVRELRGHLSDRLPDYMVPGAFVILEELPATPQGKVDKRALPAPDEQDLAKEVHVAPRTEAQHLLCRHIGAILGLDRVGLQDNFFNLGGHSLLATRLNLRVKKETGADLPLQLILTAATVEDLAAALEAETRKAGPPAAATGGPDEPGEATAALPATGAEHDDEDSARPQPSTGLLPLVPAAEGDEAPLSLAQQDLWFLRTPAHLGTAHDNVQLAVRLRGRLDRDALTQAVHALVARHAILRTSYPDRDGTVVQRLNGADGFRTTVLELPGSTGGGTALAEWLRAERLRPFVPQDRYVLRAHLLVVGEQEHVLVLTRPWGVVDGWSTGILMRELVESYHGTGEDRPAPAPLQYADFARWQRRTVDAAELDRQRDFWRKRLDGLPDCLALRTDYPRPPVKSHQGAAVDLAVPADLVKRLRALTSQHSASLYMIMLAAYAALLGGHTDDRELAVGSPVTNRPDAELDDVVGYFVNALVMRLDVAPQQAFTALLARTRETVAEAQAHRDLPFADLVRTLVPQPRPAQSPLFQVMFNLAPSPSTGGAGQGADGDDGLTGETLPAAPGTAAFDLNLSLRETDGGLEGYLEYSTDLFGRESAESLAGDYVRLLERIVRGPEADLTVLRAGAGGRGEEDSS